MRPLHSNVTGLVEINIYQNHASKKLEFHPQNLMLKEDYSRKAIAEPFFAERDLPMKETMMGQSWTRPHLDWTCLHVLNCGPFFPYFNLTLGHLQCTDEVIVSHCPASRCGHKKICFPFLLFILN